MALLLGQPVEELPLPGNAPAERACDVAQADRLAEKARSLEADPAEAAAFLLQAHAHCPSRAALLLEAARLFAEQRDFENALQSAERYLAQAPESLPGLLLAANAQFMTQRFQEAAQTADRILQGDPAHGPALKIKGNAVYLLGDSERAEQIFLGLLDKHPADADGAYMLGRIYYQENRFSHAAAQFQRVLRLNPASYKAYDNLGLCQEALGDPKSAIQSYLAAIRLAESADPDYDWPYANLASLLIAEGDPQRGLDAANAAANRNPRSARNFFLGGKALMRLGRDRDALKWLEQAVSLDPAETRALYLLGQVYRQLGDEESARRTLTAFEAAKAREPDEVR